MSSAATSPLGTMMSATSLFDSKNTFSTNSACSGPIMPASSVSSTSSNSSSTECSEFSAPVSRRPMRRASQVAVPFISFKNGFDASANRLSGVATHTATRSGTCRATVLGNSSPNTTCMKVIAQIATTLPTEWPTMWREASENNRSGTMASSCSNRLAMACSPTQPSKILATVMPSCVAAIDRSRYLVAVATPCAPGTPCVTMVSTLVRRTATRANSAATKNAFKRISSGTRSTTANTVSSMANAPCWSNFLIL